MLSSFRTLKKSLYPNFFNNFKENLKIWRIYLLTQNQDVSTSLTELKIFSRSSTFIPEYFSRNDSICLLNDTLG